MNLGEFQARSTGLVGIFIFAETRVDDRERECRRRETCGDQRSDDCHACHPRRSQRPCESLTFGERSDPELLIERDAMLLAIAHVMVDEPEDVQRLQQVVVVVEEFD